MKPEFRRGNKIGAGDVVVELVHNGLSYAIYRLEGKKFAVYFAKELYAKWQEFSPEIKKFLAQKVQRFAEGYLYVSDAGYKVYTPMVGPYPEDLEEATDFCVAFGAFRQKWGKDTFPNLLYIEKNDLLLPLLVADEAEESAGELIGKWLSDGLPVDAGNVAKAQTLCQWLPQEEIEKLLEAAGVEKLEEVVEAEVVTEEAEKEAEVADKWEKLNYEEDFILPGRKMLTEFFNEQIVDYLRHREQYKKMGISTMPATLLHGEPGSGKTYAVEQLAKYLKLPIYEVNSSSVASPYIHDTSKKIAGVFQKAMKAAPSILIIDELEAYLSSRESSSHEHHVEEVDELLRNIPKAIDAQVIVFAMTNHLDLIDKAALRKGRFDQILEVGMPTEAEVLSVLEAACEKLPVAEDIKLAKYATRLKGRPLSDTAYILREAGRKAVRTGSELLTDALFTGAIDNLLGKGEKSGKRRIGF